MLEPKIEETICRQRQTETSQTTCSNETPQGLESQAADLDRGLMGSLLKPNSSKSDAIRSNYGKGLKRSHSVSCEEPTASPVKRFRNPPLNSRSQTLAATNMSWQHEHVMAASVPDSSQNPRLLQSSLITTSRHRHFTTVTGPDVSLFVGSGSASIKELTSSDTAVTASASISSTFAASCRNGNDAALLPSLHVDDSVGLARSSPPRTPVVKGLSLNVKKNEAKSESEYAQPNKEGADLLLYLANSPSPAASGRKSSTDMKPPSTPPPQNAGHMPSSTTTPGGGNLFPTTPGQGLDFSEFLKFTPSPAPRSFKTPGTISTSRTPLVGTSRRPLTFE
jgi:hypothetical protein